MSYFPVMGDRVRSKKTGAEGVVAGIHTAKRPNGPAVVMTPDNELLEFGEYEPVVGHDCNWPQEPCSECERGGPRGIPSAPSPLTVGWDAEIRRLYKMERNDKWIDEAFESLRAEIDRYRAADAEPPIEQVRTELDARGIDTKPAMEKVRTALYTRERLEAAEKLLREAGGTHGDPCVGGCSLKDRIAAFLHGFEPANGSAGT